MSRTLLVVDDAVIIREMIKELVAGPGWEVVGEASDGREAIEQYERLGPDAVTLDLVMPQYDGLHALRGIIQRDPEAKVIVVSAIEQKGVLKEALTAGAADFVVKPFDAKNLLDALEQLVPSSNGPDGVIRHSSGDSVSAATQRTRAAEAAAHGAEGQTP